ncbi:CHY zinc finger protein [Enterococcus sp. AZ126]|uniref:CHY zinc finger protein n=1 Tax=Enterococcus sp. AZ126 TaxID=2774635 RepID=UPI003F6846CD
MHYDLLEDVIANKCYCCKKYYACYRCHNNQETHDFLPWPTKKNPSDKVVLCGVCHHEMTFLEYTKYEKCPNCEHRFNIACKNHAHYYFS